MIRLRKTTSLVTQIGGGGVCRLLFLRARAFLVAAVVSIGLGLPATAMPLPKSEGELIAAVRTAIEREDFSILDELVIWTDVSPYKRRLLGAQLRHGLGRPIEKIELEHADTQTRFDLQNMRGIRLNMPVTYLLRIKFQEEPGHLGGQPGTVYMVGKLDGVYRIALLVRDAKNPLPD